VKLLDAILPAARAKPSRGLEQRYSFDAWAQDALKFGGLTYQGSPIQTLYGKTPAEHIGSDFEGLVRGALQMSGPVSAVEMVRLLVFAEARFQWQRISNGRPGDLFGTQDLAILETPWTGGTTGDLLARMILDADFAGNSYTARIGPELVRLRPDWVDIVLAPREHGTQTVGLKRVGYAFYDGGDRRHDPVVFLPEDVAHFAPYPDPLANYRGISWLTPVIREIQSDRAATQHKLKFFENAATPNLAVSLAKEVTPEQFHDFVEQMDRSHQGTENAYRTLYTAGGADVTVIGADMKQLDFKATQGAGETRIAAAAGVGAILANLSEGMQGSSLNAGNYGSAKRRFADGTMRPLWRNAAASLAVLLKPPPGGGIVRLWYDTRDIAFLREDEKDTAEIQAKTAQAMRTLTDAGWTADSVKAWVQSGGDWATLQHSGLYSVQLLPPGEGATPNTPAAPAAKPTAPGGQ
jgi:phage portal protein BeeE